MCTDVCQFVLACLDCQATKYEAKKPAGLLYSLPAPSRPSKDLSMDFIVGLPLYHDNTTILVVVDRFSKGIHLGMLVTNYTASSVALLFMEIMGKNHGMPKSIVSDRDPLFVSRFWQELFRLSETKLRMSSSYHPQMDGQTEVLNRVMEQYLRAFMHNKPKSWGKLLLWATWCYNTSIHSATGVSPFEETFGRKPPSIPQYLTSDSQVIAVDNILNEREVVFTTLSKKLSKAQQRMKLTVDVHRWDVMFEPGEWVMVKLRPNVFMGHSKSSHSLVK